MSVFEKIDNLASANARIRTALADKGIDATDHGAEDFAADVSSIPKFDPDDYAFVIYKENDEYKRRYEYIGKTVPGLNSSHFKDNTSIVSVMLPSAITRLGTECFYSCSNLTHISLEKITTVDRDAFTNCSSLLEIVGPNITSYNFNNFGGVTSKLKRVILPKAESVRGFANCRELFYADIRSATRIEDSTFDGCLSLSEVVFGDAVTYIGYYAFRDTAITGELSFNNLLTLERDAFTGTKITKVKSLGQITSIRNNFAHCPKLTFFRVPSTVTEIWGLLNYTTLESDLTVVCEPVTPPEGPGGLDKATIVYVPDASVDTYKAATGWSAIASKIYPLSEYTGSD